MYLAILGRQPELGRLEWESILGASALEPFGDHLVVNASRDLNRLGGTLKLARIVRRAPVIKKLLPDDLELATPAAGKRTFGVSFYGTGISASRAAAAGLGLKKQLAGSWRLIAPKAEAYLSAAQLNHNQVLAKGFELIIAHHQGEAIYALTEQIQDIDWYSQRDYHKPARDSKVGMLPPKLAQILINYAGDTTGIWDPFCGSGTILMEALLMGRPAWGSDIDPQMVAASQTNLEWLASQRPLPDWSVELADATTAPPPHPGCAIVSEGYLGPNPGGIPSNLEGVKVELEQLYHQFLLHSAGWQSKGQRLVLCLPAWHHHQRVEMLSIIDRLTDVGYALRRFATADSSRLIYHRPGQAVGRQILILERV